MNFKTQWAILDRAAQPEELPIERRYTVKIDGKLIGRVSATSETNAFNESVRRFGEDVEFDRSWVGHRLIITAI